MGTKRRNGEGKEEKGKIKRKIKERRRREERKVCLDKWSPSDGGLSERLRKEEA